LIFSAIRYTSTLLKYFSINPLFLKDKSMKITAGDIMTTRFHTLTPQTPVNDAVKLFKQANEEEGRKIFGMMVIDTEGQLGG